MPFTNFEAGRRNKEEMQDKAPAIVSGFVTDDSEFLTEGKALVQIPILGQSVWARIVAVGAGPGRGFFWAPQRGDEVLLALSHHEPGDAYIIGGMWNATTSRPPVLSPTDLVSKRIIRTGVLPAVGHQIEFDDIAETITITTSKLQVIKMAPASIQIRSDPTTMINMTTKSVQIVTTESVQIIAGDNLINLTSEGITMTGKTINLNATGVVNIKGSTVNIN
jgi:type VI secretion system (T6SS) baseplate-like injector VgrG